MNDERDRASNAADRDERLVEDFFAAHRRAVVDQEPDEQTWEAIRVGAGRSGRGGRRGLWFLGGVVAASAAATAAFLLAGQGLGGDVAEAPPASSHTDQDQVVATSAEAPGATEEATDAETTDDGTGSTGTDEVEQPVAEVGKALPMLDPDFKISRADHPSGDESPVRVSVGEYNCGADFEGEAPCPVLLVSEDSGQTWTPGVDMYSTGFSAAVSARGHIWMWGADVEREGGLQRLVGKIVRSDDGGRTWIEVATRGVPRGVETFRSTLVVVTDGCEGGAPDECAEVVVTDLTADDATTGRRTATLQGAERLLCNTAHAPGQPLRAGIYATYDAVYIDVAGGVYRLADGESVATVVERPAECAEILPAPESADSLVAWEWGSAAAWTSGDGGASWQALTSLPGAVHAAASNDGRQLVIRTDEGVFVGTDGQWDLVTAVRAEDVWEIRPLGGESVRAFGGMRFVAPWLKEYSGVDRAASWLTEDGGRTWTEEPQLALPESWVTRP